MMNTHYLNTTEKMVTGRSRLDVKFEDPSPDHVVASFFTNITFKFAVMPQSEATADATCVVPHDIKIIDFSNHMHEFGTKVHTEQIDESGKVSDLQRDESWTYEWQFNPPRKQWPVDEPYVIKAGTTLHTHCSWKNPTAEMLTFPREMCLVAGFMLADTDASCVDGKWYE